MVKKASPTPERKVIDPAQFARPDVTNLNLGQIIDDDVQGRLVLLCYPEETETSGKDGASLAIPSQSQRRPDCLAFVIMSTTAPIETGDTIVMPQHFLQGNELTAIQPGVFLVNTRDCALWYPDEIRNPVKKRKGQEDKEQPNVRT